MGLRAAAIGSHSQEAFSSVWGGFGLTVKWQRHHRSLGPGDQGCYNAEDWSSNKVVPPQMPAAVPWGEFSPIVSP